MIRVRRRLRSLRPIHTLLTLIIVGNILLVLTWPLNWLTGGRTPASFWAPTEVLVNPTPDPLTPAFSAKLNTWRVEVSVADPTLTQAVLENLATGLVTFMVWLVIAVLARRTVAMAMYGDPFTVVIADRLRRLGMVILIGGGLAALIQFAATYALFHSMFPSSTYRAAVHASISLSWLPLAFAVLAFAAVVRHGCQLRAELDEVI